MVPPPVLGQSYKRVGEQNLKLVLGEKRVVQGSVRDGDEVLYRFKAKAGQTVSLEITGGRDADFDVYLNHGLDAERVAQDKRVWTGKMPPEFDGDCEVALHSNYKLAAYSLDILVK